VPPVPRCNEGASPDAVTRIPCDTFVSVIGMAVPDERQRPAGSHHPLLDVFAVDLTGGKASPVSISAA